MAVFMARTFTPPPGPIAVTITGSGNFSYCYASINGTTYATATEGIEVKAGDVITFGAYGSKKNTGYIKINGTTVVTANTQGLSTYEWTVPENIKSVSIALYFDGATQAPDYGTITVTTTAA